MEIVIVLAVAILVFFSWQLYQAKKVSKFKQWLRSSIQPKLSHELSQQLIHNRSDLFPNTPEHIEASIAFWTQYHSRIIQKSLQFNIINKQTIIDVGYYRQYQHLLFIEQQYLLPEEILIPYIDIDTIDKAQQNNEKS